MPVKQNDVLIEKLARAALMGLLARSKDATPISDLTATAYVIAKLVFKATGK